MLVDSGVVTHINAATRTSVKSGCTMAVEPYRTVTALDAGAADDAVRSTSSTRSRAGTSRSAMPAMPRIQLLPTIPST